MNKQQHDELKQKDPEFDDKFVMEKDPKSIIFDKETSQIRKFGHATDNAKRIESQIKQNNNDAVSLNLPPVSVSYAPDGTLVLKEGATRVIAACDADAEKIKVSDYHYHKFGRDQFEWKIFQAQSNEHHVQKSNTEQDIAHWISEAFKNGDLANKLGYSYDSDKEKFLKEASRWIKDKVYPNNPKTTNWFRSRLKDATKGNVSIAYENYSPKQAIKHFTLYSGTGCTSTDVGPDAATNGILIRTVKAPKRLNPNLIGYATHDYVEHPHLKTHVVFWLEALSTANNETILDARTDITNFYDKFQKAYNCFGGLWVLPQVKSGVNKEDLNDILKIR